MLNTKISMLRYCLVVLVVYTHYSTCWVDPEEFIRRKTEAEIAARARCPNNNSKCGQGRSCVLISNCKNKCKAVSQGLLQTDLKFQQHLRDIFCGVCNAKERVCCDDDSVSQKPVCPGVYQDMDMVDTGSCGVRSTFFSHIHGGEDTNPGDWPWVARLEYPLVPGTELGCGGTLVSRRHVVTAAHCVEPNIEPTAVILGDLDTRTDYDCLDVKNGLGCSSSGFACFREEACAPKHLKIKIRDIIRHQQYSYEEGNIPLFDIAVIVLDIRVDFSNFIQPACLPRLSNKRSRGPLTLAGWGNTRGGAQSATPAHILQELEVREVRLKECREQWKKLRVDLLPSHMCAASLDEFKTSCKGDSGGPLLQGTDVFELAGVISFGTETCGNTDFPMGFTRIEGKINKWLQNIISTDLPDRPS